MVHINIQCTMQIYSINNLITLTIAQMLIASSIKTQVQLSFWDHHLENFGDMYRHMIQLLHRRIISKLCTELIKLMMSYNSKHNLSTLEDHLLRQDHLRKLHASQRNLL